MADFIFRANIAHYKGLLERETDVRKIETLRRLLAEEEASWRNGWPEKGKPPVKK
ncbi:hypothetical protein [Bradyrhizobium sp. RD5-C2]|uniref:hypothetical protein n=1 Tax=Bradyrhizobium sp. RD5-C2 TaxID=244562 RepID=UPI001CC6884B|nr:hypothetical protein [Bradyrhizobium sp. RD5-C2]GIQ75523.1 hypothetical protein BraRD5C2_39640 [Bradyrhizobium sp. RD5-C2]